ncbi:MAG: exopolysaccharide biosynthesis protein [Rhodocyclaceae bacterium]|jgi:chromosome segregation ATPase|nr:MAG: exopolysaccharide biosynthesis protein [Rhodocyclaceae bacterium]
MTTETQIQADIDNLRDRFTDTPDLYRETCALLFFRYGITPTANKLYQYVRKGSMSAPAEALSKFWDELREKSRVRVERTDLPEEIKTAAGELVAKLWHEAQAASDLGFAEAKQQIEASAIAANERAVAAKQELELLQAEYLRSQAKVLDLEGMRQSLKNELSAEKARIDSLREQLEASDKKIHQNEAALVEARRDFSNELEKTRLALQRSEERCEANEKRALVEIDRERTSSLRLQKEHKAAQELLQGIHEKHAREIAQLQSELGETKLKLGSSEGIIQEMRARNLRIEEQLQSARSSAELARTQEGIAKRELEIVKEELRTLKLKQKAQELPGNSTIEA